MKIVFLFGIVIALVVCGYAQNASAPLSEQTEECIECHSDVTPGIVADWRASRHSSVTPAEALGKPSLQKRVSSTDIPEQQRAVVVGCYECHGNNPDGHKDNFEHFDRRINAIVTPDDCKICHQEEVEQYSHSKKAYALDNLRSNPVYHSLVETTMSVKRVEKSNLVQEAASLHSKSEACYACHGTEIVVKGLKEIATEIGKVKVPDLLDWPNHGVGRINPDGSRGSCTSCHPRHGFSIEVARKPYTCAQCHLEPDVPAWNVYAESKHGNIFLSMQQRWNWENVPWQIGKDFTAPTCASCHNSLLTSEDGSVVAKRSHDFGARLWVRLFGLIYSHPQPLQGKTWIIENSDGLPLPTSFSGKLAAAYLIDENTQKERRQEMMKICRGCHGTSFAQGHFARLENTLVETDKMTLAATQLLEQAWKDKLVDPSNPFDETLEQLWVEQWLFYANTVRYASAMAGPDYASFKNGWWKLSSNLQKIHHALKSKK